MHWKYKRKPDPTTHFGFVYIITNKKTSKIIDNNRKLLLAKEYIFSKVQNSSTKNLLKRFINIYLI